MLKHFPLYQILFRTAANYWRSRAEEKQVGDINGVKTLLLPPQINHLTPGLPILNYYNVTILIKLV